ncbi:MAG: glycine zipper 2TM domain-containing protein [Spongiibacteraceae bacterium]
MAIPLIIGAVIGVAALTGVGGYAGYNYIEDQQPKFAEVTAVEPITEIYFTEREECYDETVEKPVQATDTRQIAGAVIGAVLGGVLGKQVGGGNGKKVAAVAGAAAGAYAGTQVQKSMQQKNTTTGVEQRCQTMQDPHERVTGYEVSYTIAGEPGQVVMADKPGETIPLKDGKLQVSEL